MYSDLQDKFKKWISGVDAEIQNGYGTTEAEERLSSYILDEKNARESADAELQTNINDNVGNNFTIAGMTLEDNISKEELLKSLGFEFANFANILLYIIIYIIFLYIYIYYKYTFCNKINTQQIHTKLCDDISIPMLIS